MLAPSAIVQCATPESGVGALGLLRQAGSIIGPVAGAVAAIAAVRAVRITVKGRKTEHQYTYYRALVFEPTELALQRFQESAHQVITSTVDLLAKLRSQKEDSRVMQSTAREANAALVQDWNRLNDTVMTGLRAWGDEALAEDVRRNLESLQDAFTTRMEALATEANADPADLSAVLQEWGSTILGEVMARDPGIADED